jgi:cold shock CspA family protein
VFAVAGAVFGGGAAAALRSSTRSPAMHLSPVMQAASDKKVRRSELLTMIADGRARGKCEWFNPQRGLGFISIVGEDRGDRDYFVHYENISAPQQAYPKSRRRSLRPGEPVEFKPATGKGKTLLALDVTGPDGAHLIGKMPYYKKHKKKQKQVEELARQKKAEAKSEAEQQNKEAELVS